MKADLSELNQMLFTQLSQLQNQDLKGDDLKTEIERSKAFSNIARDVIENSRLALEVAKLRIEYGNTNDHKIPAMLANNNAG